ncbi:PD-(D/E)XK nuclease family protein [soil metagenome]
MYRGVFYFYPMATFLSSIIKELLQQNSDLSGFTFILPSKRAGAFLRKELSHHIEKPVFSPEIISIEDFSEKISGLGTIDNTSILFEFYSVYCSTTPKENTENFDSFTNWAQTLIQDFNEIDRYLIDPDDIFNYLAEIQDINHWSLSTPQTELVKNYLIFWKQLPFYYKELRQNLLSKNIGYQGLVYRIASEKIGEYLSSAPKHIFLGFNALNKAEQVIVQKMLEEGAQMFWDIDKVHMDDPHHDASLFIREYSQWPYYQKNVLKTVSTYFNTGKELEIIGVPQSMGQAKYAAEILSGLSLEELSSTALVLGDESLLLPVLNSLPENIPAVNITMGYPLNHSPFSNLFDKVFQNFELAGKDHYYIDVLAILGNPMIEKATGKKSMEIINRIKKDNLLYLSPGLISDFFPNILKQFISLMFPKEKLSPGEAVRNFQELILSFKQNAEIGKDALLVEFLYNYKQGFDRLEELLITYSHISSISSLYYFYKELSSAMTLDFQGKPFQGLQIMGMLETRVLDFDTVILTSVDEGTLPAGKSNNSYIPYELKKTYNLPTYKEKDAVYTYHFYHLLQRAKKVYLLHNTDNETQMGSEKSRFLLQLELEKQSNHTLTKYVVSPEVPSVKNELQQIHKTPEILNRLKELALRGFSPSALTTYIRNPLDFYLQYVLGIKDSEDVEETIALNTLGTVIHDTLEVFYSPLQGKHLTISDIEGFQKRVTAELNKQFEKTYSKVPLTRGKNLLIFEVARRCISNFLKMELKELEKSNGIEILQIESNLTLQFEIEGLNFPVNIRGKVDRVDRANNVVRIIDYKTGKVEQAQLEIINWDDLSTDFNKYAKPFQVLMYAKMLLDSMPPQPYVEAGLISFKNLKSGFLKFAKKSSSHDKNKKYHIETSTLENFSEQLKNLILEIFDPNIPFIEKEIKTGYGNK